MITPDRIKAYLDDLALISAKHGLVLDRLNCFDDGEQELQIFDMPPEFGGFEYREPNRFCFSLTTFDVGERDGDDAILSLDVSTITAHQRIALAKSLRNTATSLPAGPDILSTTSKGEDQ